MNPLLTNYAKCHSICREHYEGDESNRPNDHCHWSMISLGLSGWVENDDHLRERVEQFLLK